MPLTPTVFRSDYLNVDNVLQFYCNFIDKYIDRSDFTLTEMDTDSNYFAFSEDSIDKLIKPHMREEYEKDKYNFLPRESRVLIYVDVRLLNDSIFC
jgi:hypothetical protein